MHALHALREPVGKVRPAGAAAADAYWSVPAPDLLARLGSTPQGLTQEEAAQPWRRSRAGAARRSDLAHALALFARQFNNPLVLLLVAASVVSLAAAEWVDAAVVLVIVLGSTVLGFAQEYRADHAVQALHAKVALRSRVLRDGRARELPSAQVVAGDVVLLAAGSLAPADGVVLEADALFVNQAVLTGETFPVEKCAGVCPAAAGLAERGNCVFMGTTVSSGAARMLAVHTGPDCVIGQIAGKLAVRAPVTEFERGVNRFGYMLTRITLAMVLAVLAINIFLDKPALESLLFALALAVGLTPELLPAIVSITLSHGARRMAGLGVIVRRLEAIENLGSMDVLCTDKTGTLTRGEIALEAAVDTQGRPSQAVLRLAGLNARFQSGLNSPLDAAILAALAAANLALDGWRKTGELPYDFVRKAVSVMVDDATGARSLVMKGALENVLERCTTVDGGQALDAAARAGFAQRFDAWSARGYRVLGVATRKLDGGEAAERALCFSGFLLFLDQPRPDARATIAALASRGVAIKIVTGDNRKVARQVAEAVGLAPGAVLTGRAMDTMDAMALMHAVDRTAVFAEVDPNQKERIIVALKRRGHVVGFMGDGINDALALHNADVGISVDSAVDVAREAADFVLLRKDLHTLCTGIDEGRRTFANTLKYILTTISANFGNMFSMAAASAFLPFLPLLASQVLLNNFLSDIPAAAIAGDRVDPEWLATPHRWDTVFIRDFMVVFGLLSSAFDFLAFAVLLWLFQAAPAEFRTGWFLESLLTELVIALVVRTRRPFWRSRPAPGLLAASLGVIAVALALPYLPLSWLFGFVPLPAALVLAIGAMTLAYVAAVEAAKARFYRRAAGRA